MGGEGGGGEKEGKRGVFFIRPVSNFTIIVENRSKLVSMEN